MDTVERLTFGDAMGDSLIALTHRHRYQVATKLVTKARVVDLCCGEGYGTVLLAGEASRVTGVDVDSGAISAARRSTQSPRVSFAESDALAYVEALDAESVDVVICFEGVEHVPDPWALLDRLGQLVEAGVAVLVSLPNDQDISEDNPFHTHQFSPADIQEASERLGGAEVALQWTAEGSILCPMDLAGGIHQALADLEGNPPSRFAEHVLLAAGFDTRVWTQALIAAQSVMRPVNTDYVEDLRRANSELWAENARLGRWILGLGQASAAVAIRRVIPVAPRSMASREGEYRTMGHELLRRFPYLVVDFSGGWFDQELDMEGIPFRWMDGVGVLSIGAAGIAHPPLTLEMTFRSFATEHEVVVTVGGREAGRATVQPDPQCVVRVPIRQGTGVVDVRISTVGESTSASVVNPQDMRLLSVMVSACRVTPRWGSD